jgi:5-enolpyruvylshikimate-3-phosphate synthase
VFETPVVVEPHVITQVLSPYISVVPGKVSGEISVPGSKSISNRVLPICGLGEGNILM